MRASLAPPRTIRLIKLSFGIIWLHSGITKLLSPEFLGSLPKTLAYFASNNPFPWYRTFLQTLAIPYANVFGVLTILGEVITGVSFVAGTLLSHKVGKLASLLIYPGYLGSLSLNITFFLAAGWTGPATALLNALMIVIVILLSLTRETSLKS